MAAITKTNNPRRKKKRGRPPGTVASRTRSDVKYFKMRGSANFLTECDNAISFLQRLRSIVLI